METKAPKEWEKREWYGNPSLGYEAAVKGFPAPYGRDIPVWVWGTENNAHKLPPPADPDYVFGALNFTVSAGANSDYSYTGLCVNCFTIEAAKKYVEELSSRNKLIK